ncbi:uncharacterized protein FA14DRAFT_161359, partial [Meira miltonrushii]
MYAFSSLRWHTAVVLYATAFYNTAYPILISSGRASSKIEIDTQPLSFTGKKEAT